MLRNDPAPLFFQSSVRLVGVLRSGRHVGRRLVPPAILAAAITTATKITSRATHAPTALQAREENSHNTIVYLFLFMGKT